MKTEVSLHVDDDLTKVCNQIFGVLSTYTETQKKAILEQCVEACEHAIATDRHFSGVR